ncbi:hypothetical protein V8B97DRAFT_1921606 [Scleroderma yunnanense]
MLTSQGSTSILNPVVYLNYLTPSVANDYEITRDVALVTFGALAWDILSSIPEDYRLIRTGKASVVLFAYFLARPTALIMVLLDILQKTGPITHCTPVAMVWMGFQVISSATATYLFLKRVHAVYYGSAVVRHIFSFIWLVGVGTSFAVFAESSNDYSEIADTKHCVRYQSKNIFWIAFMVPIIFDALVYFAISYKILTSHRGGKKCSWRDLFREQPVPHFSQAVLRGGQQYYAITNGFNVSRLSNSSQPSESPTMQLLLLGPTVALTSAMACRVHRNLILESLRDSEGVVGVPLTAPRFADKRDVDDTLPMSKPPSLSPHSKLSGQYDCSVSEGEV